MAAQHTQQQRCNEHDKKWVSVLSFHHSACLVSINDWIGNACIVADVFECKAVYLMAVGARSVSVWLFCWKDAQQTVCFFGMSHTVFQHADGTLARCTVHALALHHMLQLCIGVCSFKTCC